MSRERNYAREDRLRQQWGKVPVAKIAAAEGTSVGSIYRSARRIGLTSLRKKAAPPELSKAHRAIKLARPRHEKRLVTAETSPGLFVSGSENRKIGRRVTKGRWACMPIYTLTLAERMTCPRSCLMWSACYGNNLNWPRRHVLDDALIERMRWELTALAARHPEGFVVRLHVLGDFGSDNDPDLALRYVQAWSVWLARFPALRVFGFTAWGPDTAVGLHVADMNALFADRWRVRFSGHDGPSGALVVETEADSRHVLCPFETGRSANCGQCALCWSMDRTVEFLRH